MTLKETFQKAQSNGFALGAFNVSTLEQIKAVVGAAKNLGVPVILEMSPSEAGFLGIETLAAVRVAIGAREGARIPQSSALRAKLWEGEELSPGTSEPSSLPSGSEESEVSIFLNLDHAKDLESIKRALQAGFDLVHFDGSDLPFEENISLTKEIVEMVHRRGILVEGEIDQAGGHSVLQEGEGEKVLTDPERAVRFVSETGIDILACFFGNLHGVYGKELTLDLEHLSKIKESVESASESVFLSMHGSSGVREENIRQAVKGGIVKVNVNTELRLAWVGALRKSLAENPEEIVPYKVLAPAVERVQEVVVRKIELLGGSRL